jgi:hypothetical protein
MRINQKIKENPEKMQKSGSTIVIKQALKSKFRHAGIVVILTFYGVVQEMTGQGKPVNTICKNNLKAVSRKARKVR